MTGCEKYAPMIGSFEGGDGWLLGSVGLLLFVGVFVVYGAGSSDLSFDLSLTSGAAPFPTVIRGPYLQCGTPTPEGYADIPTFEIPIQRFVTMSTSMLPHLDDQGLLDHLVGVDTTLYTSNEDVLALSRKRYGPGEGE